MEKTKNKPPSKTKGYKNTASQRAAQLAALGAINNDELNDDKQSAKKRTVAQQVSLWDQPKAKKQIKTQKGYPH